MAVTKGLEIIDKKGAAGFSARNVSKAMGYTVGTLYHVFGDLDEYMLHLNGRILDEWHRDLSAGLKRTKKDALRYLAHSYIEFGQRHYGRWIMLFEFRATRKQASPDWYNEKMGRLFVLVEDALSLHSADPEKIRRDARVLWAGIHGICALSLSDKLDIVGAEKPETLVDCLIDRYMG